ncbi:MULTISPECIES: outer membrane protein [Rhodobacterales]|uniref:outer membrane protein n=1 Tax=Rhodobacterales TaxID=204455 RepID=UPI0015F03C4D|nr:MULTISPECIES: outer membrane beta-barrel protein [Rhodobacterales]MDO6590270.1 outer membrane beta-barrel protein [Yoonia sp. 1_MG-2023]
MNIFKPVLLTSSIVAAQLSAGGLSDPVVPVPLTPPPPVAVPLDWYVGLQAGVVSGEITPDTQTTVLPGTDLEGPIYGVHAGVQRSFGSITLGAEIDYNTTTVDLEDSGTDVVIEMDTLAHLKLRAGTMAGNVFIYGTAGLAYAEMYIEPIGPPIDVTDTAPFYGLGADMMVTQKISIGGEFLLHSFEDMDGSGIDVDFNTAMLRASFHF